MLHSFQYYHDCTEIRCLMLILKKIRLHKISKLTEVVKWDEIPDADDE